MDEQSDFGSKLEDLSLGIIGKVADRYVTGSPTSATPSSPAQPMELSIPSATNQTVGFFSKYKIYLLASVIGLGVLVFLWRKK